MKTLKFTPEQIPRIQNGALMNTWRLHDEKQLNVGDEVQFINNENGETFGYGTINEIVIKRIADINDTDQIGHEKYVNLDQILAVFRKFYGQSIGPETIVKVVKYTYRKHKLSKSVVAITQKNAEVKLFTDGGSRGNPGPSATGFVIKDMDDNVVTSAGKYLGITTNNQAEYQAVLQGLTEALKYRARDVHVFMDSLLVVNQMTGVYKIKNRDLWPIHQAIKDAILHFNKVTFTHVPREMNKQADAEVNRILDAQEKSGIDSELL